MVKLLWFGSTNSNCLGLSHEVPKNLLINIPSLSPWEVVSSQEAVSVIPKLQARLL